VRTRLTGVRRPLLPPAVALAAILAACVAPGPAEPPEAAVPPAPVAPPALPAAPEPDPPPAPSAAAMPARPMAFATTLRCGERIATLGSLGDRWALWVDGREIAMRQTPGAAAGARFEAEADPRTWVSLREERAQLTLDGAGGPECVASPPGAGAAPIPVPFSARGTEPFWRLELDARRIRFVPNIDAQAVEAPTPAARPAGAGRRWNARAQGAPLTVIALDRVCADPMAGMPHPATVTVEWRGRIHVGCGGEPASLLRDTQWVVEDIDRRGIIDRSRATLAFGADGRISGRGSCNDYTGRGTLDGESLRILELAVGARACTPALADQETRFLDRLRAIRRFQISPEGALLLHDDRAGLILARR
jgi:heat shock protein HslJ